MMKTLRARITVVVVLTALVPMLCVGLWARSSIAARTQEDHAHRLEGTVAAARRRVEEREAADRRGVERLCDRDMVIDELVLALTAGRFDAAAQENLVALTPPMMRSLGLDTLDVIDARAEPGRVLASGHFAGRAGAMDRALLEAASSAGDRWFVRDVRIRDAGVARDARAVLTACTVARGRVELTVVGGRLLDDSFVASLASDPRPIRLVLSDPTDSGSNRTEVWTFRTASGAPAARLVALVDDAELEAQLDELDRGFIVAGAVALATALVLATLLALGISRPLSALEGAASRVASGDLDSTIGLSSGGEVGRALAAFNHMTHELSATQRRLLRAERIAAWRDIARRIAHEIKNPLLPIQMSIETMRKTYAKRHPDFDEIFEESTLTILEEVERLKRIVTEFSRFARLPRPRPVPLDVRDVVAHVVGLHATGDVSIRAHVAAEVEEIRADREQLTQVLVNLVQNAIDAARARHGSSGGLVEVIAEPVEGGVEITVRDNGPGIAPEERTKIFEPYFTTKSGGTGLGLAIVHRIVTDHAGTIEVDQAPGGGAELRVTLTREGPPVEADVSQSESAVPLVDRKAKPAQ